MKTKYPHLKIILSSKSDILDKWETFELTAEEYFDLDDDDDPDYNSVPEYMDDIEFLDKSKKQISCLKVERINNLTKNNLTLTYYFWNDQENSITVRKEFRNGKEDVEIIFVSYLEVLKATEILRFDIVKELPMPNYHGMIYDNEDGSQTEKQFSFNEERYFINFSILYEQIISLWGSNKIDISDGFINNHDEFISNNLNQNYIEIIKKSKRKVLYKNQYLWIEALNFEIYKALSSLARQKYKIEKYIFTNQIDQNQIQNIFYNLLNEEKNKNILDSFNYSPLWIKD